MARIDSRFQLSDGKPLWKKPWFLIGGGVVLYFMFRRAMTRVSDDEGGDQQFAVEPGGRTINPYRTWDLTRAEQTAFYNALPNLGRQYANIFVQVAKETQVSPFMLAGIMAVETGYGSCGGKNTGPKCVGFNGDDFGLMQINRNAHPDFFTKKTSDGTPYWQDPLESVRYGANYLAGMFKHFSASGAGKTVTVGARVSAKCGVLPGKKADLRPVKNQRLLALTVAAGYNAGQGSANQAVASGCNPDAVTYTGDYAKSVVAKAEKLAADTAQFLGSGEA